jgi:hypothetical protein
VASQIIASYRFRVTNQISTAGTAPKIQITRKITNQTPSPMVAPAPNAADLSAEMPLNVANIAQHTTAPHKAVQAKNPTSEIIEIISEKDFGFGMGVVGADGCSGGGNFV